MNTLQQNFIFGSDAETPHQQYVLHIDDGTLFRFIVWKFTASQLATPNAILQSEHMQVKVEGYHVYLFAQYYDDHKWKNITPQTSTPVQNIGQLLGPMAARFYLHYKIEPYAKKFSRYEDFTAAAYEGISTAHHSNT